MEVGHGSNMGARSNFYNEVRPKKAPYEEKYGTFHGEKGPHKKKKRPHKENKGPQKEKRPRNGEQKSITRRKKGPSHGEKGSLPSCDRPWVIMHLCVQMSNVMQIVDETNNITVHNLAGGLLFILSYFYIHVHVHVCKSNNQHNT